jgi:hypothetical protein
VAEGAFSAGREYRAGDTGNREPQKGDANAQDRYSQFRDPRCPAALLTRRLFGPGS